MCTTLKWFFEGFLGLSVDVKADVVMCVWGWGGVNHVQKLLDSSNGRPWTSWEDFCKEDLYCWSRLWILRVFENRFLANFVKRYWTYKVRKTSWVSFGFPQSDIALLVRGCWFCMRSASTMPHTNKSWINTMDLMWGQPPWANFRLALLAGRNMKFMWRQRSCKEMSKINNYINMEFFWHFNKSAQKECIPRWCRPPPPLHAGIHTCPLWTELPSCNFVCGR